MENCSICHDSINASTGHCTLSCSHSYHIQCLTKWSSKNPTCPLCRHSLSETETPNRPLQTRTEYRNLLAERVENIWSHWYPEVGTIITEAPSPKRYRIGDGFYTDEEDIRHLMEIEGVSRPDAFRALKRHKGDIIEALVEFQSPPEPRLSPPPRNPLVEPSFDQTMTTALQRMFDEDYNGYKWNSYTDIFWRAHNYTSRAETCAHENFQTMFDDEDKLEEGYWSA